MFPDFDAPIHFRYFTMKVNSDHIIYGFPWARSDRSLVAFWNGTLE